MEVQGFGLRVLGLRDTEKKGSADVRPDVDFSRSGVTASAAG
jgi:hypothetical protein